MKKILLILLSLSAVLFSACGEVKYEFKNGIMYADGKKATGTFEFKEGSDNKGKGTFVNGIPDGIFERYYSNGNLMAKDIISNGNILKDEVYFENGQIMFDLSSEKGFSLFFDDGQLVMISDFQTEEISNYYENGNPLLVTSRRAKRVLYSEDKEVLSKMENEILVDVGTTLKPLDDGSFEILKDNKLVGKIANNGIETYFYSTGEKLMIYDPIARDTEIFFKNGNTFYKRNNETAKYFYKDGKIFFEAYRGQWRFFDREGKEMVTNSDYITDIKKID